MNRRLFQFGTRSLLLVIALLSVLIGVTVNRVRAQRRAAELVRSVNGEVYYDFHEVETDALDLNRQSGTPAWLLELCGQDAFHTVVALTLDSPEVTDATLAEIKPLRAVRRVFIMDAAISDKGVCELKSLPHLRSLSIINCEAISDESLTCIADMQQIEELDIQNAHITDAGLRHLRNNSKLQVLKLDRTDVTKEGVADLQRMLPSCKIQYWLVESPE